MVSQRCASVFGFVLIANLLTGGWLFYLQVLSHERTRQRAEQAWLRRIELAPARGNLFSRHLRLLATCESSYSVWADPQALRAAARKAFGERLSEPDAIRRLARVLSAVLKTDISYEQILARLRKTVHNREDGKPILLRFVWIARQLDETAVEELRNALRDHRLQPEWRILRQGVGICTELRRVYPYRRLASAVLGFANRDNMGCYGVERSWDAMLRGKVGLMEQEVDALGRPIPQGYVAYLPPKPGDSLVLTIDEQIQQAAEEVLGEAIGLYRPRGAVAIVLDPKTGDLLALASKPDFDPNDYRRFPAERFINRALGFVYEPGSTLKPLIAAALLEHGAVNENSTAVCSGVWRANRFSVRCWVLQKGRAAHGSQTLSKAICNSCNIAMAQFALRLPYRQLYETLHKLGIGRRLSVGAGYEEAGWLDPPWKELRKAERQHHQATVAFGQGLAVTPMQLAVGYAALANYGMVMKPRIVKGIKNEATGDIRWLPPQPIGRAVSPLTASKLRDILVAVVEQGTGKRAKLDGVVVAGKTGTATKVVNGRYDPTKVIVSFFGFFPAENPKWVVGIVLDEPTHGKWGGEVAAPLFAALGRRILWRVQPPRPLSLSQHLTALSFFHLSIAP